MSVLNKVFKFLAYVGLILYTLASSLLFAQLLGGALLSLTLAVWTIIKPLPTLISEQMWLIYIIVCGVITLPTFIYIFVTSSHKAEKVK